MIYLTFDSNIWIYLLDDSWKEHNPLDYLESWIEQGYVEILLPDIIFSEWEKNRKVEKEKRQKELRDFFSKAEEILPSAFFRDYKKPDKIDSIIEEQFMRIEAVIASARRIPLTNKIMSVVVQWGLDKKAPMHRKTSVADAVIILSLFDFIEANPSHEFHFLTNNTEDFYEKVGRERQIHTHLRDQFAHYGIKNYRALDSLIRTLSERLPIPDVSQRRRERIRNKVKEGVFNPDLSEGLADFGTTYLENKKQIDFILESPSPTKDQAVLLISMIKDPKLEEYFFMKVESPMWYTPLKKQSYFSHENNPKPTQTEKGTTIAQWHSLRYVERLSAGVKDNKMQDLVPDFLKIIRAVSESGTDNAFTWSSFVTILSNLPNDAISTETLSLIEGWLGTEFSTYGIVAGICEKLLPKFLNDDSSNDDIAKGLLLFKILIAITKRELTDLELWKNEEPRYNSHLEPDMFIHFIRKDDDHLISQIARYCDDDTIQLLANNIEQLLFDFPKGIGLTITSDSERIPIKATIDGKDVIVQFTDEPESTNPWTFRIENYSEYTREKLYSSLVSLLRKSGIDYVPTKENDDRLNNLHYFLYADLSYKHNFDSIDDLDEEVHGASSIVPAFVLVLREILNRKCELDAETASTSLRNLLSKANYTLPLFTKIVLHNVRIHWPKQKKIFWEQVANSDSTCYLSNASIQPDIFRLLSENQSKLNKQEINLLGQIINRGPKDIEPLIDQQKWKLRWLSAVNDLDNFRSSYLELSRQLNLTKEDFQDDGKVKVRFSSAEISPLTVDQLLEMQNEEIVNFIAGFKPTTWRGPNIEGLAKSLEEAITKNPEKFVSDLGLFVDLYYYYEYKIVYGFINAWKNNLKFDWEAVLNYCHLCITSQKFRSRELANDQDGWRADPAWVKGAVAELISVGTIKDDHAVEFTCQDLIESIFKTLLTDLELSEPKESPSDYVSHSINTSDGRILQGFITYLLWVGRNGFSSDDTIKWRDEDKKLFENCLDLKSIEAHTLVGFHFSQFYFLDPDWVILKVLDFEDANDSCWAGFFSGFCFGRPPSNNTNYLLFRKHYLRAIESKQYVENHGDHAIVRHLGAFHLYCFENLEEGSLLTKFIASVDAPLIRELVFFLSRQNSYFNTLTKSEKKKVLSRMIKLWQHLTTKYGSSQDQQAHDILGELPSWIQFIDILDEENTDLITHSVKYIRDHRVSELLKGLLRLSKIDPQQNASNYIAKIASNLNLDRLTRLDHNLMVEVVTYLFESGQYNAAVNMCNELSSRHINFLDTTYDKYRSGN